MSAAEIRHYVTPEEYLARERQAETRAEYWDGQVYAMSGGSQRHDLIKGNIFGGLWTQLRGRECRVYTSDMRLKVSETGLYTYPDVSVVCGRTILEDAKNDTLLNPSVLVEVLSPSTEQHDRTFKFEHYRRLDSLQDYVLVSQDRMRVEHYQRQGEQWLLTEFDGPGAVLTLPSIGCSLPLREIYALTGFVAEPLGG